MADVLTEDFARGYPAEFALELAAGDPDELIGILEKLPPDLAVAVAAKLPADRFEAVAAGNVARFQRWLEAASVDDAIAFVGRLQRLEAQELAEALENRRMRRRLLQSLNYPSHCVGSVMAGEITRVERGVAIREVVRSLRAGSRTREIPVVVVDEAGCYLGKLDIWALALAEQATGTAGAYQLAVAALQPETAIEQARLHPAWQTHHWLPVTDHQRHCLGFVTRAQLEPEQTETQETLIDGVAELGEEFFRVSGELLEDVLAQRSSR